MGGMARLMGDSLFCFVPRGRAAWSVRYFESFWAGCIPVILSDAYEVPFASLFDVTKFMIRWPDTRVDRTLLEYLDSLPLEVIASYQREGHKIRCWYTYPPLEVSWMGSYEAKQELAEFEREACPNMLSTRNAYEATQELLRRKTRKSKVTVGPWAYPESAAEASRAVPSLSD